MPSNRTRLFSVVFLAVVMFSALRVSAAESAKSNLMRETFSSFVAEDNSSITSANGKVRVSVNGRGLVIVREAVTNRPIRIFPGELLIGGQPALALTNDGGLLAGRSGNSLFEVFSVWDVASGARLFSRVRAFTETNLGSVSAIAFSKDGKYLAVVTDSGVAEIWDALGWRLLDSRSGFSNTVKELDFPDDDHLALFSSDGTGQLWNVISDTIQPHAEKKDPAPAPIAPTDPTKPADLYSTDFRLTADDRLLLPGDSGRVFDLRQGTYRQLPPFQTGLDGIYYYESRSASVYGVSGWSSRYLIAADTLDPLPGYKWDARGAIAVSRDGSVVAVQHGTKVSVIRLKDKSETSHEIGFAFERMRFGADPGTLILEQKTGLKAFSLATDKEIWLPRLRQGDAVSDDLRFAVHVQPTSGYTRVFDLKKHRGLYEIPGDANGGAAFSDDGALFALPLRAGQIAIFEAATGKRKAVLAGFPHDLIIHIQFMSDKKRLVASSDSGFIRVWEIEQQREILSLSLQGMNWAAFTGSGHYDGSPEELHHFYWVEGVSTADLSARNPDRHVPGLIKKVWAGEHLADDGATGCALSAPDLPIPELVSADVAGNGAVKVKIDVAVRSPIFGKTSLFGTRNGIKFKLAAQEDGHFRAEQALTFGCNRFVIWAEDSLGRKSAEVTFERNRTTPPSLTPEIEIQTPHSNLTGASFSNDSQLLLTRDNGHAFTLWDLRSKRQIRTVLEHNGPVSGAEFDKTDHYILTTSDDGTSRVWETETGAEACRIESLQSFNPPVAVFSPDGARFAVLDGGSIIRVFETRGCSEVSSYEAGLLAPLWADRSRLMFAAREKELNEIVSVDLDSGEETHIKAPGPMKHFAVLHGRRLMVLLKDGSIQLQDQAQGFHPLSTPSGKVQEIAVTPADDVLIDYGKTQSLFSSSLDVSTPEWKDRFTNTCSNGVCRGYLASAAFSPDGQRVATVDTLGNLKIQNRVTGLEEGLFVSEGRGAISELRFSDSGDVLAVGRGNIPLGFIGVPGSHEFELWDVAAFSIFKRLPALNGFNWFFTSDLHEVAAVSNGIAYMPFKLDVERAPNGQLEIKDIAADRDHIIKGTFPAPETSSLLSLKGWRLAGRKHELAMVGRREGELRVVDLETGQDVGRFRAHPDRIEDAALSPDGERLATLGDGSDGASVRLWRKDGTPVWRLEAQATGSKLAFSGDGSLLVVASTGRIAVFDTGSAKIQKEFEISPAPVTAMAFSPANQRLAVGTADGVVNLFDLASGSLIATLVSEDEGVLVFTPDAFYSGTLAKTTRVAFRIGSRVFPLRQFDLTYNRPDVVISRLAPDLQPVIRAYEAAYRKRVEESGTSKAELRPNVQLPQLQVKNSGYGTVTSRNLLLAVEATSTGAELSGIETRVNGVREPLFDVKGKNFTGRIPITLSAGANQIEIVARDKAGQRSLSQQISVDFPGGDTRRTLYVVTIGVSHYADDKFNLSYAAKDARDLQTFFKDQDASPLNGRKSFDKIETVSLTDADATRDKILQLGEFLATAGVDDTVVVFFAGHGLLDKKLDFYLAPYDIDFTEPGRRGISLKELEGLLSKTRSRRRLLLVDSCHSGELDSASVIPAKTPQRETETGSASDSTARGMKVRVNDSAVNSFELLRSLFMDLRDSTGTEIISAARGSEVAYEFGKIGNGAFTRAVLDGLEHSAADQNGDGHVSVSELMDFVLDRVQLLTKGRQTPTFRQQNIEQDFILF